MTSKSQNFEFWPHFWPQQWHNLANLTWPVHFSTSKAFLVKISAQSEEKIFQVLLQKSVNFHKIQLLRKALLQKAATFCYKKRIFEVDIFRDNFLVKIVWFILNNKIYWFEIVKVIFSNFIALLQKAAKMLLQKAALRFQFFLPFRFEKKKLLKYFSKHLLISLG